MYVCVDVYAEMYVPGNIHICNVHVYIINTYILIQCIQ